MTRAFPGLLAILIALGSHLHGQTPPARGQPRAAQRDLLLAERKPVSQDAGAFWLPAKCDANGNIYLRTGVEQDGAMLRIDGDGKTFPIPSAPVPNLAKTGLRYFAVEDSGAIHQLADFSGERDRFIVHFKPDGSYVSRTRLQLGAAVSWRTSQIAVFPSGGFLVAGKIEEDGNGGTQHVRPFTGIFSADGLLLREVRLPDDDTLGERAKTGESASSQDVGRAISYGSAESAPDGNVYVMRRVSPVMVSAISPGGEVIRSFTVTPPHDGFSPIMPLHISGARMAILFDDNRGGQVVKVVSLEGEELATYGTSPGRDRTGPVLACYSADHERFTFLGADKGKVVLNLFEPQ